MASITDQYFSVNVSAIQSYSTAGAEKVLNGPMRHFMFYNPSVDKFMYVSWSGNDDHVLIPPGKGIIVRDRSQVERIFVRGVADAGTIHVSCSSHNSFGAL